MACHNLSLCFFHQFQMPWFQTKQKYKHTPGGYIDSEVRYYIKPNISAQAEHNRPTTSQTKQQDNKPKKQTKRYQQQPKQQKKERKQQKKAAHKPAPSKQKQKKNTVNKHNFI